MCWYLCFFFQLVQAMNSTQIGGSLISEPRVGITAKYLDDFVAWCSTKFPHVLGIWRERTATEFFLKPR